MRICAKLPYGARVYKAGQKGFGRLAARPMGRLPLQSEMARWLMDVGIALAGLRFMEVGTGHVPLAPIGFSLRRGAGCDRRFA